MISSRTILAGLLGVHAVLLGYTSYVTSPVEQEPAHLIAGYSNWQLGKFHIFHVNPPLVRSVAALPVLLLSPTYDRVKFDRQLHGREERALGSAFLADNQAAARQLLVVARWACISFSLVGAYFCWRMATTFYGSSAGFTALILWCFSPYILGHGATIVPDVAAAALGLAAVDCFWRWLKTPLWTLAMVAGAVLGVAELTKFTLLVLYPVLSILWLSYRRLEPSPLPRREWVRQGGMLATLFLVSVYVINSGYLFEGTFTRLGDFHFRTSLFTGRDSLESVPLDGGNRFAGTWLSELPVPLPANMVQGIDTQRCDFERGMPSYLAGQRSEHGWWYYYVCALALKVPLGMWCLMGLAAVTTIFRSSPTPLRDELVILVPGLAILLFVSSQNGFSVHSRYALPALPFFIVWASKVAGVVQSGPFSRARIAPALAVITALAWSVTSSLWVYPHSISYFNELAGGPKNGGAYLLDSNIDWGQDVLYLNAWLGEHHEVDFDGVAIDCYCAGDVEGIAAKPSPPPGPTEDHVPHKGTNRSGPRPGWYALGVNYLYQSDSQYSYFLRCKPIASAGYSIYIYHITLDEANRVRRELGMQPIRPIR